MERLTAVRATVPEPEPEPEAGSRNQSRGGLTMAEWGRKFCRPSLRDSLAVSGSDLLPRFTHTQV